MLACRCYCSGLEWPRDCCGRSVTLSVTGPCKARALTSACLYGVYADLLLVLQPCVLWIDTLLASEWGLVYLVTLRTSCGWQRASNYRRDCSQAFQRTVLCCDKSGLTIAGQFFQNTNWLMTSVVLAWVAVTIGYIVVRATESLNFADNSGGLIVYGIVVLTVEVSPRHPQLLFSHPQKKMNLTHVRAAVLVMPSTVCHCPAHVYIDQLLPEQDHLCGNMYTQYYTPCTSTLLWTKA